MSLKIFFSHRVESLYNKLKKELFKPGTHPFARRMVVVPSPAMKAWLHIMLAGDPECGIAAGLETGYFDQIMHRLLYGLCAIEQREPSLLELAFIIEAQLSQMLRLDEGHLEQVKGYLGGAYGCGKKSRRLAALSVQLARLFEKYGVYGGAELGKWPAEASDWQKTLWSRVWQAAPALTYPIKAVDNALNLDAQVLADKHIEVHLFSISFLPAIYQRFLLHLSQSVPVHFYILSPCQAFWSDIKSDRECHRLYAAWKEKGASEAQLQALEDFLRDRNPLLANFGRLGREMAEQVELSDCQIEESYSLPQQFWQTPPYEGMLDRDIASIQVGHALSLLNYIQADLTLMRTPCADHKISIASQDRSLQVHACPSKRREVEVLSDVLKGIIMAHRHDADPITAGDIVVMASDVMDYEPYIKIFFGQEELDYQLMEVDLLSQSMFAQSFSQLLELAVGRWDAAAIIAFVESPFVQKKMKFSADEVSKFREWTVEAGIRWGENTEHCDQILKRDLCEGPLLDKNQPGTWEDGLARLLAGMAYTQSAGEECQSLAPLEIVETASGELLGRWIEFLRSLKADLDVLQDGAERKVEQWVAYLRCLMDAYLAVDAGCEEELGSRAELVRELEKLGNAAQFTKERTFSYAGFKIYLEEALQAKKVNYRESHLHAVRFCSMLPMRALPAKVIVLLGMQDSAFPRCEAGSEMNLLKGKPEADYIPSQNDFDRSLFLEAILSARQYFLLFYTLFNEGKEESPSMLLTEFLSYIDEAYESKGGLASAACSFRHPLHAFDASNFQKTTPFPSYSAQAYKEACAYYQAEKRAKQGFIPDFAHGQEQMACKKLGADVHSVEIGDLIKAAKNPFQLYFNRTLGMYVQKNAKRQIEVDEKFIFNALDMHKLKGHSLSESLEQILQKTGREGSLPAGLFKDMAEEKIGLEISKIEQSLGILGLTKDAIVEICLAADCEAIEQTKKGWRCPSLKFTTQEGLAFEIAGKIKNAAPGGLLVFKEGKFEDLVDDWPAFLVLAEAVRQYHLPIQPHMIALKDCKTVDFSHTDLQFSLSDFLEYYLLALQGASPLLPKWLKPLISEDVRGLEKTMHSNLSKSETYFFNDYVKWCFQNADLPDAQNIVQQWHEVGKKVFGPLKEAL